MKKKKVMIPLMMAGISVLCGCGSSSQTQEVQTPVETESEVSETVVMEETETEEADPVAAAIAGYKEILAQVLADTEGQDPYDMGLFYGDEDNVPELFVADNIFRHGQLADIYTCIDGEIVQAGSIGEFGVFEYAPKQNMVVNISAGTGAWGADYMQLSSGTLEKVKYFNYDSVAGPYEVDDSEVTAKAYSQAFEEFDSQYTFYNLGAGSGISFPITEDLVNSFEESYSDYILTGEAVEREYGFDYILPGSDVRYITEEDIADLTSDEIRIAKNEIFARHGRKFKDSTLQAYFDSQSWYEGKYDPDTYDSKYASELNAYEKANAEFLAQHQSGSSSGSSSSGSSSSSSSSGSSASSSSSYADFSDTYKKVCDYGFYSYENYSNISNLFFQLDYSSIKDCGDYCEVHCELQKPVIITEKLSKGQSYTFTSNELTNEKMTLTMGDDGVLRSSNGWEYEINDSGYLMYYQGSEDYYWVPFYNGTIRVYEGAPVGHFMNPSLTFPSDMNKGSFDWLNGLNFDSKGYVTAMLFFGD